MQIVCTACSCLCDDVIAGERIYHSCRKGCKLLRGEREETRVNGEKADFERALKAAEEVLGNRTLILGLDNSVCEAQKLAIKLAKDLNGFVVDHSLLSGGKLIEFSLEIDREISFEKFRDEGYLSFYWGANPHNSVPRHLSRFTYYPRSGKRQRGYEEDRFLVVADIRKSETAKIAEKSKSGIFVRVESDLDLIDSFKKALEGKAGKHVEAARILKEIEKADVNAVFAGSGLSPNVLSDLREILEMLDMYFVPLTSKTNMRGFVETMLKETGHLCYDFGEGEEIKLENLKNVFESCKAVLVVGADPLRTFPYALAEKLLKKDIVVVNSLKSLISLNARVTLATELSCFAGGTMLRSDGVKVEIEAKTSKLTDLDVFKELL